MFWHRKEKLRLVIKASQQNLPTSLLKRVTDHFMNVKFNDGDSVEIYYNLDVNYLGKSEKSLNLILEMLNYDKDVIEANVDEVRYGRCVVKELFNKIEAIEKRLMLSSSNG